MNAADTIDAKRSKRKAIILPSHSGSREHTQGPWHGLSRPVLQVNGRRLKKGDHAARIDDAVVATEEVAAPPKQVRKSKLVKKPLNMNDKTTCDCCCCHRSTPTPIPIVAATSAKTETDSSLAETTKMSMLLTASQQQQQLLWAIAIMLGIFLLLFVICVIVYFVRQSPSAPSRVARVQYVYD